MDLLLSSRGDTKLQEMARSLSGRYPSLNIQSITCDLSSVDSWHSTSERLKEFQVERYINCSGIQGKFGLSSEMSYDEMIHVFKVNLFSSIYFSNFFTEQLLERRKLSIIHFSGGGATGPRPLFMPYSLSKTSLLRFVENFAVENVNKNVRINAVAPGVMPSKMQQDVLNSPKLQDSKDHLTALKSLSLGHSNHSQLLKLCDFLLSDKSQGISGKLISAEWDNWSEWPNHLEQLEFSDLYTLRRITGRDRGQNWGDL